MLAEARFEDVDARNRDGDWHARIRFDHRDEVLRRKRPVVGEIERADVGAGVEIDAERRLRSAEELAEIRAPISETHARFRSRIEVEDPAGAAAEFLDVAIIRALLL